MKGPKPIFTTKHVASSILMMLTLLWFMVCTPFVAAQQIEQQKIEKQTDKEASDNDSTNSLTGSSEEKSENGVNTLSEYLHEYHLTLHHPEELIEHKKCTAAHLYLAYHPELLSPPPEC